MSHGDCRYLKDLHLIKGHIKYGEQTKEKLRDAVIEAIEEAFERADIGDTLNIEVEVIQTSTIDGDYYPARNR